MTNYASRLSCSTFAALDTSCFQAKASSTQG